MEKKTMKDSMKTILEIQELDMKMIRLMRVKIERKKEIEQIESLRQELHLQLTEKEKESEALGKQIQTFEQKIQEILEKIKKLEGHQSTVKKADEFQAITQEMSSLERERHATEQKVSDLVDKRVHEEELVQKIRESLQMSEASSQALEKEILEGIQLINQEGTSLKTERERLSKIADQDILHIYERLLRNKKDRVVVPIENRTCSGCHIAVTAQHESLVRKGSNLIFCEYCSRIHYWYEAEIADSSTTTTKRRRRRMVGT